VQAASQVKTGTSSAPAEDAAIADLSFPKSKRLLKHSDFDRVYRTGRRFSQPDFAAFYLRREEVASGLRVGFTVGRVLGGAVQRNRIRRRLREAIRLSLPASGVAELAADVVIQPRKSALQAEFEQLQHQVEETLAAVRQNRGAPARPRASDDSPLRKRMQKATEKKQ